MPTTDGAVEPSAGAVLSDQNQIKVNAAQIVARIERMPMTRFHIRARLVIGTATFFDALDALAIAYVMPVLAPLSAFAHQGGHTHFDWFSRSGAREHSLRLGG